MAALLCILLAIGQERLAPKVTTYVGAIRIWGNIYTEESDILVVIGFGPGQRFVSEELKVAERNLLLQFPDRFAWWMGHRPCIRVDKTYGDEKMRFHDLRLEFYELKRNR